MAFDTETGKEAGKKSKRSADTQLKELRKIYSDILENNKDNIQSWFDKVAKDDTAKALELMLKLSSFIIPKPRSIEITTDEKNNNFQPVIINLGSGTPPTTDKPIVISFKD